MKNSLFKRVFATVASVPLALSQCLTYTSYAVTNDSVQSETGNTDSSEKEAYTLKDNLLYIAPGQIESTWYSAFNAELVAIGNKNNENYIAKDTIVNKVLNRAGKYSEKAQLALDMLGEDGIKYTISNKGDITITGDIVNPDISAFMDIDVSVLMKNTSNKYSVSDMLKELADKYNAPGIADIDFSGVDFSGTYEIVIEGSDLADGHTMDVKAKYIANTAVNGKKEFAVGDAADFALAKINEAKAIAHAKIDAENIPADAKESAKAEFDSKFTKAEKWINKAKDKQDKIKTLSRTESSPNMASLIKTLNEYIDDNKYSDKIDPYIDKIENKFDIDAHIPATVNDIMNNSYVSDIFDIVMQEINKITVHYDVQITKNDVASFADNDLYNLNASANNGTYILTGDFPDDEVADSVKHMVATVEAGDIYNVDNTLATVGLRIYRDPVTTTTTTSSTTTSSTTTTTVTTETSDSETSSSTTTTETSGSETSSSTTTTETSGSETGSSTTTTETSGSETGSSTTTTETSGSETGSSTTTTETSTGSETSSSTTTSGTETSTGSETSSSTTTSGTETSTGSETSSTTTTSGTETSTGSETSSTTTTSGTETSSGSETSSTTTTTGSGIVLNGEVKRWSVTVTANEEAGYAFYYNHEEEFEKDQISSVILNVTYVDDTTEDIKIDFDYASTPKETFTVGDLDFKYNVPLVYVGEQIIDITGKVVLADGDTLKAGDDKDATVEVYIGYMGDINFDYKVNAVDGSIALSFYAKLSTMRPDGTYPNASEVILSTPDNANIVIDNADSIYDHFAAFLADTNQSNGIVTSATNRQAKKGIRMIDANDATAISVCYAELSRNETPYEIGQKELWDAYINREI